MRVFGRVVLTVLGHVPAPMKANVMLVMLVRAQAKEQAFLYTEILIYWNILYSDSKLAYLCIH
ncbi:hypothetical protein GCM10025779_12380 [Arthrobacter cryoconiti]